jgi:hypothetical protein
MLTTGALEHGEHLRGGRIGEDASTIRFSSVEPHCTGIEPRKTSWTHEDKNSKGKLSFDSYSTIPIFFFLF